MVAAAVKFTQGVNVGTAGQALVGLTGQAVTVANGDDTGVSTHLYELLSAPINSALTLGTLGTGTTTSFTPDVSGSYRVRVTVTGTNPSPASDTRVFGIANTRGWIVPAFGGRATEHNFSGQDRGWSGTNSIVMMDKMLADVAASLGVLNAQAALTVVANPTNATAVPTAVAGTTDQVLRIDSAGTALGFGSIDLSKSATVGTSKLALANFSDLAGLSVLARASNTTGVMAAVTAAADGQVFLRSGTSLVFGTIVTAGITDANVTYAKIQNGAGLSVLGRSANTSGVNADITAGTDGHALRRSGTTLGFGTLAAGAFAAGTIALSVLATQAALSVVANATNATASPTAVAGTADQVLRVNSGGTALGFGAVNLAAAAAVTGLLAFANLADGSARSVLGRAANTSGVQASIAGGGAGTVLVDSGTALSFSTLLSTSFADGTIALSRLASIAALSVVANATNASASPTAVAGTADQVLRVSSAGTALAFGAINLAAAAAVTGLLPFANIDDGVARSVFGRAANTSGVQASIAGGGAGTVLIDSGTALSFSTLLSTSFTDGTIALSRLVTVPAITVLGNATNATAAVTAIAGTTDQVMRVNAAGTGLGFGAINLAASAAVTGLLPFANIANGSARSVLGRSANTAGVQASIAGGGAGTVLIDSGTALSFSTLLSTSFTDGTIALSRLVTVSALSVLANATASTAAVTAVAGTADQVLRVNSGGTALGFGAVNLAAAAAVTGLLPFANIADGSARSVFGRSANTSGVQASIAGAGAGTVLIDNGTTLSFATIGASSIGDGTLPLTKLANGTACSVVGRSANTTGAYADISIGTNDHVLMRTANVVTSGFVADANVSATAAIAGTKISPNFGSQTVVTTGAYRAGTNPATSGAYNLANATDIRGRNAANSADAIMLRIDSSDTVSVGDVAGTGIRLTTAGVHGFRISGTDAMTLSSSLLTVTAAAVSIAASNAAASGNIRLANGGIIRGRNNANTADLDMLTTGSTDQIILGNSSDCSVLLASQNVLLRPAGTDRVQVTDTVFEWRLTTVRFDVAVSNPVIQQESDTTTAVTADTLTLAGQDATGTGATVGGPLNLRGGNSTTGTGGAFDVRSGAGASATTAGAFTMRIGSTVFLSWAGTAPVASQGALRLASQAGIYSRNNANSADVSLLITNSGDGVFVGDATNSSSMSLQTSGSRLILGTNIEIQNSPQLRFDSTVASPNIIHEADTTTAVTGDLFLVQAQNVTGTGATVGGIMSVRGGDSTTGTGGAIDLRSGVGATSTTRGDFLLRLGNDIFMSMPGTNPIATSGNLRMYHGSTILTGRDSGNTTNAALMRWGVTTNDMLTLGNTTYNTEMLGATVSIGDGSTYLELAVLATNREVLSLMLGSNITTTEMPANTGDKVIFLATATTAPSANPSSAGIIVYANSGAFVTRNNSGQMLLGSTSTGTKLQGASVELGTSVGSLTLFSSGELNLGNASGPPGSNPGSGVTFFCIAGELWVRGGAGTIKKLAEA